jgi:CubicO group peptidase (beta-lactamase class C family)
LLPWVPHMTESPKHFRAWLTGLAAVLLLALASGCAQLPRVAADAPLAERVAVFQKEANKVLASVDPGGPGLSVVVSIGGDVVFTGNAGLADVAERRRIDGRTSFELASLSKPITAIAVLQLVEHGKLRLDDSAARWLPELPATWAGITVGDLLAQRSGVPEFMTNMTPQALKALDGLDNITLIRKLAAHPDLAFAPGTASRYSNTNYVLLSEIVARSSGIPFARYVKLNVFDPLGLTSSFVYGDAVPPGVELALNFGATRLTNGIDLHVVGPLGIYSSTSDMSRLIDELIAGHLLTLATVKAMTSPQSRAPTFDSGEQYGYGWAVPPAARPAATFAHLGEKDGFRSIAFVDTASGVRYVILANGGNAVLKARDSIRFLIQTYLQWPRKS